MIINLIKKLPEFPLPPSEVKEQIFYFEMKLEAQKKFYLTLSWISNFHYKWITLNNIKIIKKELKELHKDLSQSIELLQKRTHFLSFKLSQDKSKLLWGLNENKKNFQVFHELGNFPFLCWN